MKRIFLPLLMSCGLFCSTFVLAAEETQPSGAQETPKEASQPADSAKPADQNSGEQKKKQGDKKEGGGSSEEPGCDK